jgi:hypothetical protein
MRIILLETEWVEKWIHNLTRDPIGTILLYRWLQREHGSFYDGIWS